VLGYSLLVINLIHPFIGPSLVPQCIFDVLQAATLPINESMQADPTFKDSFIIFGSGMLDILLFWFCVRWVVYARNYRVLITVLIFYLFRAFLQRMFYMTYPPDYIWGYPGFPSIAVDYQKDNDFFYSGHLGFVVIMALEYRRQKQLFWLCFTMIAGGVNFLILLSTRCHYCIDLFIGMVMGHYCYIVGEWISIAIEGKYVYQRTVQNEEESNNLIAKQGK